MFLVCIVIGFEVPDFLSQLTQWLVVDLANGKSADICVVCVHTHLGKDVFLFDSRSFGLAQAVVTFACDLILYGETHHSKAVTCFSTFLAQMTPCSQKRNNVLY